MSSTESSASAKCKDHAQTLRQDLSQLAKSLQKMGESLHNYDKIVSQTEFLSDADTEKLLDSWKWTFKQVTELDFDIRLFVKGETPVTVVVAGGFSSGKSTFLNGLLGIDLLEIADGPASKMVVNIKYGSVESYYEIISPVNEGESFKRRQISKKDLEKLQLDDKSNINDSVSELEIQINSDTLRAMTLIDTPGLQAVDKKGGDTEGTIAAVKTKADILFWLVDANRGSIPAEDEKELKKFINAVDHPVIILNQIDKLAPKERESIQKKVHKQLDGLFGKGEYSLFSYSAKVVFENRLAEIKRREAIRKLAKGFAGALERGSHTVEKLGSDNSILVMGFQGPLVRDIDMAPEVETKIRVSDPELLRKKEEVLSFLNEIIKDRPNLMLKYNLKVSHLREEIKSLDKSIKEFKDHLERDIANEKKRIKVLLNRGSQEFEKSVKEIYEEFNMKIIDRFISTNIEHKHIVEGRWYRNFEGELRIRFDFDAKQISEDNIEAIFSTAQNLSKEFDAYGVGADVLERFNKSIIKLIDALLNEALHDLKPLLDNLFVKLHELGHKTTDEIVIKTKKEDEYLGYTNIVKEYFEILVTNNVFCEFCDSVFIPEISRSIDRFFTNIEDVIVS